MHLEILNLPCGKSDGLSEEGFFYLIRTPFHFVLCFLLS